MKLTFTRRDTTRVEDHEVLYDLITLAEVFGLEDQIQDLEDAINIKEYLRFQISWEEPLILLTAYLDDTSFFFNPYSAEVHFLGASAEEFYFKSIPKFKEMQREYEKKNKVMWLNDDSFVEYLESLLTIDNFENFREINNIFFE